LHYYTHLVEYGKVMFFPKIRLAFGRKSMREGVMRSVYTLAFIGCISFAGFTAQAQPGGSSNDLDALIESITATGTLSERAITNLVQDVRSEVLDSSSSVGQQTSAIAGTLVVEHAEPVVNRTVIEIIDTRTGRTRPKLKINFAEFPLRSLTEVNRPSNGSSGSNGRTAQTASQVELVALRIQSRLQGTTFHLAVEDRIATISGTAATGEERKLIEAMLRLEPGISSVKNEMTVKP